MKKFFIQFLIAAAASATAGVIVAKVMNAKLDDKKAGD